MLIVPDGGLLWQGQEVGWVRPNGGAPVRQKERDLLRYHAVGMVFQSFNLFPHMTALQNIVEAPVMVLKRPVEDVAGRGEGPARESAPEPSHRCVPS